MSAALYVCVLVLISALHVQSANVPVIVCDTHTQAQRTHTYTHSLAYDTEQMELVLAHFNATSSLSFPVWSVNFTDESVFLTLTRLLDTQPLAVLIMCEDDTYSTTLRTVLSAARVPHAAISARSPAAFGFSLTPSSALMGRAFVRVSLAVKAKYVSFLYNHTDRFAADIITSMLTESVDAGVSVREMPLFEANTAALAGVRKPGAIVVLAPFEDMLRIIANAYTTGVLASPHYVWILQQYESVSVEDIAQGLTAFLGAQNATRAANLLASRALLFGSTVFDFESAAATVATALGVNVDQVMRSTVLTWDICRAIDGISRSFAPNLTTLTARRTALVNQLTAGRFESIGGGSFAFGRDRFLTPDVMAIVTLGNLTSTSDGGVGKFVTTPTSIELPLTFPSARPVFRFVIALAVPSTHESYSLAIAPEWTAAFNLAIDYYRRMSDSIEVETRFIDASYDCERVASEANTLNAHAIVGPFDECILEFAGIVGSTGTAVFSFGATSPRLSNKTIYPNFFRLPASDVFQGVAIIEIMTRFGWTKLGTVASMDPYSFDLTKSVEMAAMSRNITVVASERFLSQTAPVEEILPHVLRLKQAGSAVNFIGSHRAGALVVLEAARILGMTGSDWVWLAGDSSLITIATDELESMSMIGTQPQMGSGKVFDKWLNYNSPSGESAVFRNRWSRQTDPGVFIPGAFNAHMFDTVTAVFTAIDRALHDDSPYIDDLIKAPENITLIRKAIIQELRGINSTERGFDGAIGERVYFDEFQDGPPSYEYASVIKGKTMDFVGYYSAGKASFYKPVEWGDRTTNPPSNDPTVIRGLRIGFTAPRANTELHAELVAGFFAAIQLLTQRTRQVVLEPVLLDDTALRNLPDDTAVSSAIIAQAQKENVDALILSTSDSVADMIAQGLMYNASNVSPILISFESVLDEIDYKEITAQDNSATKKVHPNLFYMQPSRSQEGEAIANVACEYSFRMMSVIRSSRVSHANTASRLTRAFQSRCNGVVMADVVFPHNDLSEATMSRAMEELKRSDTAVFFMIASTAEEVTAILQHAKLAGLVGPEWVWLHDKKITQFFISVDLHEDKTTGFLGLKVPSGQGTIYDAFVSMDDSAGRGQTFRNKWTTKDAFGSYQPDPRSIAVHDAILSLHFSLHQLILGGNITFAGDEFFLRSMILQRMQRFNTSRNNPIGAIGRQIFFDSEHSGTPFFSISNVVDGRVKILGSVYPGEDVNIHDLVTWPSGSKQVPSGVPVVRKAARVLVVVPADDLASKVLAALNSTRIFQKPRISRVSISFEIVYLSPTVPCSSHSEALSSLDEGSIQAVLFADYFGRCSKNFMSLPMLTRIPGVFVSQNPQPEVLANNSENANNNSTRPKAFFLSPSPRSEGNALGSFVAQFPSWKRIGILSVRDSDSAADHDSIIAGIRERLGPNTAVAVEVKISVSRSTITVKNLINQFTSTPLANDGLGVHILIAEEYMISYISDALNAVEMLGTGWTWIASERVVRSAATDLAGSLTNAPALVRNMILLRSPTPKGALFEDLRSKCGPEMDALRRELPDAEKKPLLMSVFTSLSVVMESLQRAILGGSVKYSTSEGTMKLKMGEEISMMQDASKGVETLREGSKFFLPRSGNTAHVFYDVLDIVDNVEQTAGNFSETSGMLLARAIRWAGGKDTVPSDVAPLKPSQLASNGLTVGVMAAIGISVSCTLVVLIVFVWYKLTHDKGFANALDLSAQVAEFGGTKVPQELERDWLTFIEVLGGGMFGDVHKATIKHAGVPPYTVAVKTLKEESKPEDQDEFFAEACIMAQFDNNNVIALVGVVTTSAPMLVVLQYAEHGSLLEFVRGRKGFLELSLVSKVYMARDIANGMQYVAEKRIIHRDLAARNVLLDANFQCKVADFGHARAMDDEGKYVDSIGKVAVRWSAPESLSRKEFSVASDIWSYGVVLFEIFTSGELPYGNMTNMEVFLSVQSGMRLRRPASCPEAIYADVFRTCWKEDPKQRITFKQCSAYLEKLLGTPQSAGGVSEESSTEMSETDDVNSSGSGFSKTPSGKIKVPENLRMAAANPLADEAGRRRKQRTSSSHLSGSSISQGQNMSIRSRYNSGTSGGSGDESQEQSEGFDPSKMNQSASSLEDEPMPSAVPRSAEELQQIARAASMYTDFCDMSRFDDESAKPPPLWRGALPTCEEVDEMPSARPSLDVRKSVSIKTKSESGHTENEGNSIYGAVDVPAESSDALGRLAERLKKKSSIKLVSPEEEDLYFIPDAVLAAEEADTELKEEAAKEEPKEEETYISFATTVRTWLEKKIKSRATETRKGEGKSSKAGEAAAEQAQPTQAPASAESPRPVPAQSHSPGTVPASSKVKVHLDAEVIEKYVAHDDDKHLESEYVSLNALELTSMAAVKASKRKGRTKRHTADQLPSLDPGAIVIDFDMSSSGVGRNTSEV